MPLQSIQLDMVVDSISILWTLLTLLTPVHIMASLAGLSDVPPPSMTARTDECHSGNRSDASICVGAADLFSSLFRCTNAIRRVSIRICGSSFS